MISFRHHVASLVAVFLALAVGIALGGGPLSDLGRPGDDTADTAEPAGSDDAELTAEFGNDFAAASAATLYAQGLRDHAVAVLAMPGADTDVISTLTSEIAAAGAGVTGTFDVQPALVDPEQKSLVDSFSAQLVSTLDDARVDEDASTYVQMGQIVGLAVGTTEDKSVRPDETAVTVRQTLTAADLLESPVDARLAPLVLVVLPPGETSQPDEAATRAVLSGLMAGLDNNTDGVVVVGDIDSADDGELAALRSVKQAGQVSSVDGVETELGQVSAVLALIAVLGGTSGSYGASGPDGTVPIG